MWDGVKDCEQIKLGSERSLTWGSNGNVGPTCWRSWRSAHCMPVILFNVLRHVSSGVTDIFFHEAVNFFSKSVSHVFHPGPRSVWSCSRNAQRLDFFKIQLYFLSCTVLKCCFLLTVDHSIGCDGSGMLEAQGGSRRGQAAPLHHTFFTSCCWLVIVSGSLWGTKEGTLGQGSLERDKL